MNPSVIIVKASAYGKYKRHLLRYINHPDQRSAPKGVSCLKTRKNLRDIKTVSRQLFMMSFSFNTQGAQ
ncbi:hypothetical protein KY46_02180 [Photobacterium halotolerans]|uniref:Uncharacterized protein n=1 Tax=Photobacterium halotolerans TaxID=265726 RepID=A0A0F5VHQ4_9GAMM|nr:hypothetical protein KY46_02180 [Photobacterium halotolerans]